jgi:hypothetical protein
MCGTDLFVAVLLAAAQAPTPTVPDLPGVNPEILTLVIQDQWDRGIDMFGGRQVKAPDDIDWAQVAKNDAERHAATRKLMKDGKLQSGKDYQLAALIFQHSSASSDLALAHTLAVTAVSEGERGARWLAAATFDRLLRSVEQPQVFGTQFFRGPDRTWSMEPYDRTALSDSVRESWCVVSLAEQEKILDEVQRGRPMRSTGTPDCE